MTLKQTAPYDDKNASDYREMSRKLADALEEIERDPSIPATQKELAKRAKCSRGTLRNRGYPITRLKNIAANRRENKRGKPKKITLEHRTDVEAHIEDKKRLLEQLEKSRTEAAIWFNKLNESDKAKKKIEREKESLLSENRLLKERIAQLEKEQSKLKTVLGTGKKKKKKTVLPFRKSVKGRGGRKGDTDD